MVAGAIFDLNALLGAGMGIVIGDPEPLSAAIVVAQLDSVALNKWVDFFVGDGVLIS